MKKLIIALALSTIAASAVASDNQVNGYMRKDGTYVQPHMQTNPNSTKLDNYSTQGNTNPYTGQQGTVNPYNPPNPYGQPARQPRGNNIP